MSYTTWTTDASALAWFDFTPFAGGTFSIGAAASPTFRNCQAVGLYGDVSVTLNFADIKVRYFEVTTSPFEGIVFIFR